MNEAWHERTALELGAAIGAGEIDAVALAEHFFARIAERDPYRTVYIRTTPERALAEAEAARDRAKADLRRSPLDGVPISWKDLFDTAGTTTTAGSPLLADRVPDRDAAVLARATRAGLVCLGKTSLTEFAYSGLGINPSLGTPVNPLDQATPRVPGGSSSGAGVSIAAGLAAAAIGTDTGGSVRIPAAFHGLVGLKLTYGVLPLEGVVPLWPDVDSPGPLSRDVADANALFAVLAARPPADLAGASLKGIRFLAPTNQIWGASDEGMDEVIEDAVNRLEGAGATVSREDVAELNEFQEIAPDIPKLMSSEAYAVWGETLESQPERVYGPILDRFRIGRDQNAAQVIRTRMKLGELSQRYRVRTAAYAALLTPTVPMLPPPLAGLVEGGDAYMKSNLRTVSATRIANLLKLCAITLPCGTVDGLPVGLMLSAQPYREKALLRIAAAVEAVLAGRN